MPPLVSQDVPGVDAPGVGWRRTAVFAAAAVALAVSAVILGGRLSGAYAPLTGFSDPGTLARYGLPVVTVLVELVVALTLGSLVLAVGVLPPGPGQRSALGIAGAASAVWAVLAVVQLVLRYAIISGSPPTVVTFGDELWMFVSEIPLGRNYLLVVLVAAATSIAAFAVRGSTGALWALVLAAVAVAGQANTGHAAGAASHELAISSMFLHLVGAGVWIGGLATLAIVRLRGTFTGEGGAGVFADVVQRYSRIAGWCYLAVGVSGLVNASIRIDGWAGLSTTYGTLLLVKAALMMLLGVIGFAHRELVVRGLRWAATSTLASTSRPGLASTSAHSSRPARTSTSRPGHFGPSDRPDGPKWPGRREGGGSRREGGTSDRRSSRLFWRLVAVEVAVMGAVSGVAVALSSTAPPVSQTPYTDPTPAELVTGHSLPPEPTTLRMVTEWRWDLLFAFLAVAGLVTYLRWAIRLAHRGDRWPLGRSISWCCGMVLVFWVTSGGPATYGHVLFSIHMVQHMVLAMVIPIFLALAAPVTLLLRAVPSRKDGSRGPREWVLTVVHSAWGRFFANPLVAAANFAGSMIVFYYTGLFELALTTYVGHVAMIVHFSLAGYLFVNALAGTDPGPKRPPYPQRLLLLFATMAFHAFFGVALTTGTALLVPEWFGLLGRPWGPSAIEDQQRGGGVAWGIGELPTLTLAIVVAVMWTRSDEREARRRDRRVDRDGDVELAEYNAMLARLAERDETSRGSDGEAHSEPRGDADPATGSWSAPRGS